MSSMKDVAKLAGVSISTVSRVVNNQNFPIDGATRQKVLDAIKKIADLTNEAGLISGIHCDGPETILTRYDTGYRYATLINDTRLLFSACQNGINAVRGKGPAEASKSY